MMFLSFRSLYFASFWVLHQLHLFWLMNYNDIEWLWGKGRLTTRSFWIHHPSRFFHTQISTSKNWSSNNQLTVLMILPWFIRFILFCFSGCLPSKQKHLVLCVCFFWLSDTRLLWRKRRLPNPGDHQLPALLGFGNDWIDLHPTKNSLRWCYSAFRKLPKNYRTRIACKILWTLKICHIWDDVLKQIPSLKLI